MKIKNNIERYLINENSSILESMKVIDSGEERIGFLVDANRRLLKVITDGDIRRAILRGMDLHAPVCDIHDRTPFVVKENQSFEEARKYLNKRITVVPIVNNRNQIKGLIRFQDVQPFINIKSREVMILGLGYVGLTLALVLADAGFSVTGYDIDSELIEKLMKKQSLFYEKGIEDCLQKHIGNGLRLASFLDSALADIYIITVGTPVDKKTFKPDLSYIEIASEAVGSILKKNDLVVLRSTVPIGVSRNVVLPKLEQVSKLKPGEDFLMAFCPERTAEGRALEELRKNPQIVGGLDLKSTELASRFFNEVTHTVIDAGSLEGAELCKLLDNTYRDVTFAYANQMALLCEKVGLNLNDLIDKVNLGYGRNSIPKPSPGVGGACLSKDPYILIRNFEEFGIDASLTEIARQINESSSNAIYERSNALLSGADKTLQDAKVFILGFAFKGEPETSDLRDSTTCWFLDVLKHNGVKNIWGYDPIVDPAELEKKGVKVCSVEQGFNEADAVFIMNNHRAFSNIRIIKLLKSMNHPALFFDSWQIFHLSDIKNVQGIIYASVGVGQ